MAFANWLNHTVRLDSFFISVLTVAAHASGKAFLEAAVLAAVAVQSDDEALAVPQAPVLDLLLDAATKETLKKYHFYNVFSFKIN